MRKLLILMCLMLVFGQVTAQDDNPIDSNDSWTPIMRDVSGIEMVFVPAGEFMMGSTDEIIDYAVELCLESGSDLCGRGLFDGETPAHPQIITEPFWIDRYEVTRLQYELCIYAGACTATTPSDISTDDDQPINHVTWAQAVTYCEWRGGRLPDEIEWEYAARGVDSLIYPWGDQFDAENAVFEDNSDEEPVTVGSYETGISWVGAYDMSGNLWEWTHSTYGAYPDEVALIDDTSDKRVIRGGSYKSSAEPLRSTSRFVRFSGAGDSYDDVGFRCVLDDVAEDE